MNQRLVIFIAVVCVAQLGVTVFQHVGNRRILASSSFNKAVVTNTTTPTNNPRSFVGDSMLARASFKSARAQSPNSKPESAATQMNVALKPLATPSPISAPTPAIEKPLGQNTRDPFVPFFAIRKDSAIQEADPLTQYELSDLRLTAVIRDDLGNYSASVQTSQGRSFIVKKGTKLGKHGGYISDISPTKISISENVLDSSGQRSLSTQDLAMKTPPTPFGMTSSSSGTN